MVFLHIKSLPNLLFGVLCLPGDQSHPFVQPTINPLARCICWAGLLGRAVFPPWNEGPNSGSYMGKEFTCSLLEVKEEILSLWTACMLSHSALSDSAIWWTVACQAPLTMGFSKQSHEKNIASKNTGVSCHFLLQGIFPTEGWNLCLLHYQADSLPLYHLGSAGPHGREAHSEIAVAINAIMKEIRLRQKQKYGG